MSSWWWYSVNETCWRVAVRPSQRSLTSQRAHHNTAAPAGRQPRWPVRPRNVVERSRESVSWRNPSLQLHSGCAMAAAPEIEADLLWFLPVHIEGLCLFIRCAKLTECIPLSNTVWHVCICHTCQSWPFVLLIGLCVIRAWSFCVFLSVLLLLSAQVLMFIAQAYYTLFVRLITLYLFMSVARVSLCKE